MTTKAAVLGAGSWGTALAKLLADNGHDVRLWARRDDQVETLNRTKRNDAYLPGFDLPANLIATSDLREAFEGAGLVVSVVPTHGLRHVWSEAAALVPKDAPIVSATKGIEVSTLLLVSQIFEELLPSEQHDQLTYLAGPSFAREVAGRLPTAVSIAGKSAAACERAQDFLRNETFRVYTTDDVIGAEIGGALKNVIAIAAGVSDGLGFGHNTRAALITRGLAEMTRLAVALGGHPMTMAGLAGMGDLVLTCTGDLSRNRKVGLALGQGQKLDAILAGMTMVAEGVRTTRSAHELAEREKVEMPITHAMYRILYEDQPPRDAVVELMTRRARPERDR
ncbi:MAG: NAD(P)H-dependent glycerol-3-phosphate dehydrogenase [Sandaracinaceae bacterium]|nr:NAD(P)H-dependent glycerol-3-phosphate dehydrogenase [Sandaracinaceae bacterium]